MKTQKIKKIIYICNHATFFLSHRYNLIELCLKNKISYKLFIGKSASNISEKKAIAELDKDKINYKKFNFHTSKFNIFYDFFSLLHIFYNIFFYKPSIIHAISNKPILYSIILSPFIKSKFILSFSGFGYLYTSNKNSINKFIFEFLFKLFLNDKCFFITQNTRDFQYLNNIFKINKNKIFTIKGSGIDLYKFNIRESNFNKNIILFPARPLYSKGIKEFCDSANIIKKKYKDWRFIIVGDIYYQSPDIVDYNFRVKYQKNNIVEFWGHKENMIDIYQKSKIVCLPSYREGFPKVLMEAAAMGLPIITSDDPGCAEAILENQTGYIVPKKNTHALVDKIINLMNDKSIYEKFSKNSVIHAHNSFSIKNVTDKHFKIYNDIINE